MTLDPYTLSLSPNVVWHHATVTRARREAQNGHRGAILWFTGLSSAGHFRNSQNKLAYAYLLTPQGIESKARMTVQFLKRKMQEYERLHGEIEALRREAAEKGLLKEAQIAPVANPSTSNPRPSGATI